MTQPAEYKTKAESGNKGQTSGFPRLHVVAVFTLGLSLAIVLSLLPPEQAEANRARHIVDLPTSTTEGQKHLKENPATIDNIQKLASAHKPESTTEEEASQETTPELNWSTLKVKSGDSLSFIFQRAGLSDRELMNFLAATPESRILKKILPGQKLEFLIDEGKLQRLKYHRNQLSFVEYQKSDGAFVVSETNLTPEIRQVYREATIKESLFLAAQKAELPAGTTMELAGIFGWDVDFALDIRTDDSFKVLYEEKYLHGKKIGEGKILAAEFTNQGNTFKAVYYEDSAGDGQYYAPNGDAMRKAFLRTPIDFARISSHFNLRRKHPILNTIRAHKGTDYAAPTGTPIKAAGDGKVTWAATKGGYGKTVIIQHGQSYKTLYAHMSKYGRGIRNGKRVKQGQIIGYVGTTGRSTGPHLHYEFYKNGAVRNPVTVKLPKAESIASSEMARFKATSQIHLASLESKGSATLLAANTNN